MPDRLTGARTVEVAEFERRDAQDALVLIVERCGLESVHRWLTHIALVKGQQWPLPIARAPMPREPLDARD